VQAEYWIAENASAYQAEYALKNVSEYTWWDLGLLGERIPIIVDNVSLRSRECDPCSFTSVPPNQITFNTGDYTLSFGGAVHNNHILLNFETPSYVLVHIPTGLDVRNPLLGVVSPGATITEEPAGILISWNDTQIVECRFYDPFRETLLVAFLTFWVVIAVVLLFPFLVMRRKQE
jgi:hypothetical protein